MFIYSRWHIHKETDATDMLCLIKKYLTGQQIEKYLFFQRSSICNQSFMIFLLGRIEYVKHNAGGSGGILPQEMFKL